jgi:metallophosphoesterase superfamily enzyme
MTTTNTQDGMYQFEDWLLIPEGAAICAAEQTAVIADVHLGYEWARGAAGDCVVAHSLDEAQARLEHLLARAPISRLVVAGDWIESPRAWRETFADADRLRDWLAARGVSLLVLEGNHDRPAPRTSFTRPAAAPRLPSTCVIAGWTIGHGHKPLGSGRTVSGHHHPVFRHDGTSAPCFMVGHSRIVLPAFSANAAGLDVRTAAIPRAWRAANLRCIVSAGDELLDFGPINALRRRLRRVAT